MQISAPAVSARLRRHSGAMARFGAVGVGNVVTEFAVFAALLHAGLPVLAANTCGFLSANAQSYVVNAHVTFRKDGAAATLSWPGYRRFFLAHCLSLAMSTAFILAFAGAIGPFAAKAAAALFGFIANYAMSALFVFRERGPRDAAS
ncbi:MAG: GtrA family protein [Parvularculaceae bacterium]|nr:GtrA family protein [Parvularculaceae bacterium]